MRPASSRANGTPSSAYIRAFGDQLGARICAGTCVGTTALSSSCARCLCTEAFYIRMRTLCVTRVCGNFSVPREKAVSQQRRMSGGAQCGGTSASSLALNYELISIRHTCRRRTAWTKVAATTKLDRSHCDGAFYLGAWEYYTHAALSCTGRGFNCVRLLIRKTETSNSLALILAACVCVRALRFCRD